MGSLNKYRGLSFDKAWRRVKIYKAFHPGKANDNVKHFFTRGYEETNIQADFVKNRIDMN